LSEKILYVFFAKKDQDERWEVVGKQRAKQQ
jgi:hypothetical protein